MNQLLSLRFNSLKMLHVKGRRFPNSCDMCDVWVPLCSQIICYVSIAVNIVLALIPYQQYQMWIGPGPGDEQYQPFLAQGTWQKLLTAFVVLSLMFALVRHATVAAARLAASRPVAWSPSWHCRGLFALVGPAWRPAGAPSCSPRVAGSAVDWGAV